MYYYAAIDPTKLVCYDIIVSETPITDDPYYISIESENKDLIIRYKYVDGQWLTTTPAEAQYVEGKYIGLGEIWLDDAIYAVEDAIEEHSADASVHVTSTERTNWNAASAHANATHAPANAEVNQNAFSNIVVGSNTISADTKTDTLTIIPGDNVMISTDASNDSLTIFATDTVYTHPTTSGNKHIPAGGSSGQILRWSADGTAVWGNDNNTTYANATQSASGLMSSADKVKMDGIAENANNYVLPSAGSSLGGVKSGGDVTISDGTITVNDDSHSHVINNIDGLQSALDGKSSTTHSHTISNIDGLQSALDGKSTTSHKHYATTVTTTGKNLDDYTDAGIYTFAQAYAPTNVPAGTNGWLVVIPWTNDSATIKQIWFRHGTVGSNDFETYVRTKIGTNAWGSWSKYYTTSNPPTFAEVGASPACTNSTGGVEYSYGSGSGKNVLTEISNMPTGIHTAYAISGTTGNPRTSESFRFLVHKTSTTIGWVLAWDAQGSFFTNYQSAANTFKGWKCIYDTNPNSMILWSGASYLTSTNSTPQVVTPSKKLSECRTGWLLLWSDYDPGDGANDSDFCTTFIPKFTPSGGTWGGKAFYCDIPMYVGGDATDLSTEKRCIKPIYVHDNCIKGSYQNASGGRNDVVLRAVYEV